jgi:hypothetical protein
LTSCCIFEATFSNTNCIWSSISGWPPKNAHRCMKQYKCNIDERARVLLRTNKPRAFVIDYRFHNDKSASETLEVDPLLCKLRYEASGGSWQNAGRQLLAGRRTINAYCPDRCWTHGRRPSSYANPRNAAAWPAEHQQRCHVVATYISQCMQYTPNSMNLHYGGWLYAE